jgi:LuxR family transcriptional regulator, maltose regulon positive regulatory protein
MMPRSICWMKPQRFYVRTPIPNLRPVEAMKARIYLKQNRLDKAQAWAAKSGLSLQDKPDYLHEFERLTLAKIVMLAEILPTNSRFRMC